MNISILLANKEFEQVRKLATAKEMTVPEAIRYLVQKELTRMTGAKTSGKVINFKRRP